MANPFLAEFMQNPLQYLRRAEVNRRGGVTTCINSADPLQPCSNLKPMVRVEDREVPALMGGRMMKNCADCTKMRGMMAQQGFEPRSNQKDGIFVPLRNVRVFSEATVENADIWARESPTVTFLGTLATMRGTKWTPANSPDFRQYAKRHAEKAALQTTFNREVRTALFGGQFHSMLKDDTK